MITTVTLNATVDKTCFLSGFQIGRVNRVPSMHIYPGGKGINAARVAHMFGCPVLTTGFTAGFNGTLIEKELSRHGILHDFVRVKGESRVSLYIIDPHRGTATEILEQGPIIEMDDVLAIKDKIRQIASYSSVVAICGSMPEGAPSNLYADFIEIAKGEGAKVILDAKGDALREGIRAMPHCIKPNEHEWAEWLGHKPADDDELYESIYQLHLDGIECVAVSLGERGAAVACDGQVYRVHAPAIHPVNPVGSGDSFVGGMATALYRGENWLRCVRLGVAAGTANVLSEAAGVISLDDVKDILRNVKIEKIR